MSDVKITRLPAGPVDADLFFDRFCHDDAGHSPSLTRSTILAHKSFNEPLHYDGRRSRAKSQAE